jgi:hypothetical protein
MPASNRHAHAASSRHAHGLERNVGELVQPAGTTGAIASTASGSDPGWRVWAVTQQVVDMYATGAAHGFVIFDQVETQDSEQTYRSRESGSQVPTLVISFRPN